MPSPLLIFRLPPAGVAAVLLLAACGGGNDTRTCNGCQSPRRGSALNSAPAAGFHPKMLLGAEIGEPMAETPTRPDSAAMDLETDEYFSDEWRDSLVAGCPAEPDPSVGDVSLPSDAVGLDEAVVDRPDHIQPRWAADRGQGSCVACHDDSAPDDPYSAELDLRESITWAGRRVSNEKLTVRESCIDPYTGLPKPRGDKDGDFSVSVSMVNDVCDRLGHLLTKSLIGETTPCEDCSGEHTALGFERRQVAQVCMTWSEARYVVTVSAIKPRDFPAV